MCAREYSGWAVALMEKNAGKEDRARARVCCALGDLRRAWRNTFLCATMSPRGLLMPLGRW